MPNTPVQPFLEYWAKRFARTCAHVQGRAQFPRWTHAAVFRKTQSSPRPSPLPLPPRAWSGGGHLAEGGVVGQPKRNPHSGDIIGSSRSTSDVTAKVRDQAAVDLIAVLRCSKSHCHFIINQAYMASWEELREFGLLFLCKLVCHNS